MPISEPWLVYCRWELDSPIDCELVSDGGFEFAVVFGVVDGSAGVLRFLSERSADTSELGEHPTTAEIKKPSVVTLAMAVCEGSMLETWERIMAGRTGSVSSAALGSLSE